MPNKINYGASLEMFEMMHPAIKPIYLQVSKIGWQFWIVDQRRGHCAYGPKEITIPTWAVKRSIDYYNYYLSHELAHVFAGNKAAHGDVFMRAFAKICPIELQHYEHEYKPQAAARNGIGLIL